MVKIINFIVSCILGTLVSGNETKGKEERKDSVHDLYIQAAKSLDYLSTSNFSAGIESSPYSIVFFGANW
jgi:hypothetical protein